MSNNHRFFAYLRRSMDDPKRQQLTIEAQRFEIKAFAKANNLTIVAFFEEHRTAKTPGRQIFRQMLDKIKAGKADAIIALSPDRLSRNSLDGGEIIHLIDVGVLHDLKFPQFWFENTAQGKYFLAQAFANSKFEVDTMSARVKTMYREKVRRGIYPLKPPFGYVTDPVTKVAVFDRKRAILLRKTFKLYATGNYAVSELRERMTAAGLLSRSGTAPSLSQYYKVLTNPFYYGIFCFTGEWHEGVHKPLVPKSLFDAVQTQLHRQGRKRNQDLKPFLYRGLFTCAECSSGITFEVQRGHGYLRCTKYAGPCSQPYLRQEKVITFLQEVISSIALPGEVLALLQTLYAKEENLIQKNRERLRQSLTKQLDEVSTSLKRLIDLAVSQTLNQEEFAEAKQEVIVRKTDLRQQIADLDEEDTDRLEPIFQLIVRLNEAAKLNWSLDEREILEFLKKVASNFKLGDRTVLVTLKKPFALAAVWKTRFALSSSEPIKKLTYQFLCSQMDSPRTSLATFPRTEKVPAAA